MNIKTRIEKLEQEKHSDVSPKFVVCWCARGDGQHDEGCPALDTGEGDTVFVVVYDQEGDTDEHKTQS